MRIHPRQAAGAGDRAASPALPPDPWSWPPSWPDPRARAGRLGEALDEVAAGAGERRGRRRREREGQPEEG
jgi:hypothetical protein